MGRKNTVLEFETEGSSLFLQLSHLSSLGPTLYLSTSHAQFEAALCLFGLVYAVSRCQVHGKV